MKWLLACAALLAIATSAKALDRSFENSVADSLQSSVPEKWFVRASWRGKTLVVFVSPPPPESFRLWYASGEQREMLEKLCRAIGDDIWRQIAPDQDIAMEQVVGGNGGKGSWQLSCRMTLAGHGATD